jgi:hypothetical protein
MGRGFAAAISVQLEASEICERSSCLLTLISNPIESLAVFNRPTLRLSGTARGRDFCEQQKA